MDGHITNPTQSTRIYDRSPEKFRSSAAEILLNYVSRYRYDELETPAYETCADITFNSKVDHAKEYLTQSQGISRQIAQQLNDQHRKDYKEWGGVNLPGWLNRANKREKLINQ